MLSRWSWFTDYAGGRKLDWSIAIHMTGFGVMLGMPYDAMRGSAGLEAASRVMPEYFWAWTFGGIGAALIYTLHADRGVSWPIYARAVLMLAAMLAFLAYGTPFLQSAPHSPGTYNQFSFALLFCGSGFMAACRDVGRDMRRRRGEGDD